jgi:hypothetical protein
MANIWGFRTPSLGVCESDNSDLPPDTTRTGMRSSRKSNLFSGEHQFAAIVTPSAGAANAACLISHAFRRIHHFTLHVCLSRGAAQAGGHAPTRFACLQWHFGKHPLQQLHLRPTHPRLLRRHPQPLKQLQGISPSLRQLAPQRWIRRPGSGFSGNCWPVRTCACCAWPRRQPPPNRKIAQGG